MTSHEEGFTCLAAVCLIVVTAIVLIQAGVFEYVLMAIALLWAVGSILGIILTVFSRVFEKRGSSPDEEHEYEGFGSQSGW